MSESRDGESPTGNRPLRIAVAGAGTMALHHIRAIQSLQADVRIVAVADPSAGARAQAMELAPRAEGGPDLADLLRRVDADVVHVCTPME